MSDTESLDAARYPSVAAYLARIPGGLAAHPECVAKASLFRSIVDDKPLRDLKGLPPAIVELILHPPPPTAWVPEVHFRALMRAVYDTHFASRPDFYRWAYEAQRRLFDGPLYRILFAMVSPERVAVTAEARWGKFHKGFTLDAKIQKGLLHVVLGHPSFLADAFDHHATLEGVRAALELAGAAHVTTTVDEVTSTCGVFTIRWE